MSVDEIKKEFIQLMEQSNQNFSFPRKYFGCLIAIFIEGEPVTQDRIMALTGYPKATISQLLKEIQDKIQIWDKDKEKAIKKKDGREKDRKRYYSISSSPRKFMLDIFNMIIESYKGKTEFVLPIIEEIKPYVLSHVRFQNFYQFLNKFYDSSKVFLKLLNNTSGDLNELIDTGHIPGSSVLDNILFESPENMKLLLELMQPPEFAPESRVEPIESPKLSKIYSQAKYRFYQEFRANLNPYASQIMVARTVIGTELLLENCPVTQAEIEKSTNFARSLISDVISLLLDYKMIRLIKKPHDRKKYYVINQSWDVRTINRIKIFQKYAMISRLQIGMLIKKGKKREIEEEDYGLMSLLSDIHQSYAQFYHYYKFLEMKYLNDRLQQLKNIN